MCCPRSRDVSSCGVSLGYRRCIPRVIKTECLTDQPVVPVHTIHLIDIFALTLHEYTRDGDYNVWLSLNGPYSPRYQTP